ncbi:Protein GLUTELIN PRECURSOR ACCUMULATION 3 [Psilocybe cubensis]|uniref:Protein GLUTELIN ACCUMULATION 3 n=1 Tax=Psilocybe cubensis TaxID=181762 RepID=A0ACB8HHZ1_PSICU|nr:Protein GLUTELIN PRECURSOR ACCUMULATION 3 [Psilocybe cubensis]KAH9487349.1 Protein GLUTELIN PRECURSOR ACCUMULATION 3 [Psilocybe cubensis]
MSKRAHFKYIPVILPGIVTIRREYAASSKLLSKTTLPKKPTKTQAKKAKSTRRAKQKEASIKVVKYSANTTVNRLLNRSFGGTDGKYYYGDTWSFNLQTRKWTELNCLGLIPSAREGHAAAIVGDIVYIFGGRDTNGKDLSDMAAFKLSTHGPFA